MLIVRSPAVIVLVVNALIACGDDPAQPAPMGTPSVEGTAVTSFERSSCSTGDVLALSKQIAEEVHCMMPGQLVVFEEGPGIEFTGAAVLPYVSEDARAQLYAAIARGEGKVLRVTSAFRTVVQQYLIRRWFELGRCGITAAAEPGRSNHESGRALDVSNYSEWISAMESQGWSHNIPGDPVHFEQLTAPDIRGADVLAFQRLWNRNAPDDQISEDGEYGPATEARIQMAPAEGFGIGAICGLATARVIAVDPVEHDAHVDVDDHATCGH